MNAGFSSRSLSTAFAILAFMLLAACGSTPRHTATPSPHYKIGNPYQVKGRWYYPKEDPNYQAVGVASWYGREFHGRPTANGEIFDMNMMSAAHKTLPLPSIVEVKNLENGRKINVRVNDRGPFAHGRVIDMSRAAARRLGFEKNGLARVRVRYLGRGRLAGSASPAANRPVAVASAPTTDVEDGVAAIAAVAPKPENPLAPEPTTDAAPVLAAGDAPAPSEELDLLSEAEPTILATSESPISVDNEAAVEIIPAKETALIESPDAPIIDVSKAPESVLEALYVIRVATLSRLDNIEVLKKELADAGPLRVSRVETEAGDIFFRINMGPYVSPEDAEAQLAAVHAAGYDDAKVVTLTP